MVAPGSFVAKWLLVMKCANAWAHPPLCFFSSLLITYQHVEKTYKSMDGTAQKSLMRFYG